MKRIEKEQIIETVKNLCIKSNKELPPSVQKAIIRAEREESSDVCKKVLNDILQNLKDAEQLDLPICQDTGLAVVFLEVGQDLQIAGCLEEAVQEGVRRGYCEGYLRKSIVSDPLRRENTQDNTPAILYTHLVPGDGLKITVSPKGFGSENMSAIRMMNPSATVEDVIDFIVSTVETAGSKPCPPILVGVGIGGDFEYAAFLAKKALIREEERHPDPFYAELENTICKRINQLGIGAQGFGGDITALSVQIETYATHIAGLPVAVNIGCHVTRHQTAVL